MRYRSWLPLALAFIVACSGSTEPSGDKLDGDGLVCQAQAGTYDHVAFTLREVELLLDLLNRVDPQTGEHVVGTAILDSAFGAGLDADTVRHIERRRADAGICDMDTLAAIPEVGEANMERARQYTAVWETSLRLRLDPRTLAQVVAEPDGVKLTRGDEAVVLEMANNASVSQLDAIPNFRRDAAQQIISRRRSLGRFEYVAQVADVFGVGSAHMKWLVGHMADWRRYGRAATARCEQLQPDTEPSYLEVEGCAGIEATTYQVADVSFSVAEATLALDLLNRATHKELDGFLDRRAADSVIAMRDAGPICDLGVFEGTGDQVGEKRLEQIRRFTLTWERHLVGGEDLASLVLPADTGVAGVMPISVHEKSVVLQMVAYATEEQLDVLHGFRANAAAAIVRARQRAGAFVSLAQIAEVDGVGPAHINILIANAPSWREFVRNIEDRGACADFLMNPVLGVGDGDEEPFLTPEELGSVAQSLDFICPDTFCGGDWDYRVRALECDFEGACDVMLSVQSHYQEDAFSLNVLDGLTEEQRANDGAGHGGPFTATLSGIETIADDVWISLRCSLGDRYRTRADVLQETWQRQYSTGLYEHLLDCVDSVEPLLYALSAQPDPVRSGP